MTIAAAWSGRLRRNALAGGGRYGAGAVVAFAVTPYALRVLGAEAYGLWAVAGSVLVTVRLVDLGIGRAVARTVAVTVGPGSGPVSNPRARAAVDTGVALTALLGAGACAGVAVLHGPLVAALRIPPALAGEAAFVLVGSAGVGALEGVFAPYAAAVEGRGRLDLAHAVDIVQRVASGLGVVVVLAAGWGLTGLVLKNAALALVFGLAYRALLGQVAPGLASGIPRPRRAAARPLLAFGRHIQAVNLSALIIEPVNKALLARGPGLAAVALYEVAMLVVMHLAGGFNALAQALFPEAAHRARRPADQALVSFWRQAERPLALAALPAFVLAAALGVPFMGAWLGPEMAGAGRLMALLAAGWLVAVVTIPAFLIAQGAGAEALSTRAALVTSTLSIVGAAVLVGPLGAEGVALGRSLGLAAGGAAIWLLLARQWRRPAPRLGPVLPLTAAALAGATSLWVASAAPGGLIAAGVAGTAGLVVYLMVLRVLGQRTT